MNTSSETYFDSLVRVIGPVRKAVDRKCQEHSLSLNVDLQSQLDSVPTKLVQLINFLQDGIDLNDKGYPKEALAISQTIMYNFRYNIKNKGYNRDGAFLFGTYTEGILTVIAKDNIDQNSKSTFATRHYHRTSLIYFSVFNRSKPCFAVEYGDPKHSSNRPSLKIDALPSTYTCVINFLTLLQTLTTFSKLSPTPFPTSRDFNYRNGI